MRNIARTAVKVLMLLAAVWFVVGFLLFPDGPIQPCGSSYCGKQHQPHTRSDYELYQFWDISSFWLAIVAISLGGWLFGSKRNPYEKLNAQRRNPP
jgi:hypothetical protein